MSRFRVAAHDRFSFVCRYDYVLIVGDHSKQIHCKYINHIIDGHHIALFDHIISYPVDYEVLFFNSIRLEQTDYPVCIPYGRDLGSCHYDSPVSSSYGVLKALFYTGRAVNDYVVILVSYLVYELDYLFRADRCLIDDINTARMSKEEALALKNDYEHRLADFESERADILENTRRKAAQMEERILLDGQQEADRVIARAKREAELKKTKLMEDVRHDMIMAASITACKLAAETLDDKKQAVYIQEMLDEMGESTWQN